MAPRPSIDQTIRKMEGSDDSDLEITDVVRRDLVSFDDLLDAAVNEANASHTDEDASKNGLEGSPAKPSTALSRRKVEFSDDESSDAAYKAFKSRKTLKRRQAAAGTRKAKARAISKAQPNVVGRRKRNATTLADDKNARLIPGDDSSEDEQLGDDILPDYVKERRSHLLMARPDPSTQLKSLEELRDAGFRVPPERDDILDDASDDLLVKPDFSMYNERKPSRPYEDIPMSDSAGLIPAPAATWLRDYQVDGVKFLHNLFVRQRGGILGDDMGLGKTIQVIVFLTAAFNKYCDQRDVKLMRKIRKLDDGRWYPKVLIVCPGTLMENWRSELRTWGWWQVQTYHGTLDQRTAALQAAASGRLEIMITTYTTYRLNKSAVNTVAWDCVIADECHQMKSRSSEIAKAMNDVNALCRIGLTGTAIQNKYDELWTLLNWTTPGRFGMLSSWKQMISEPLKIGQSHDATMAELAKARDIANSLVRVLLPQFFLRRMKTLIADQLPKKSDRVVFCPLTDTQADAYQNFINSETVEYIRTSQEPCDCNRKKKRGWCCYTHIPGKGKWQNQVFPCIATLQKLANHAALLIPSGNDAHDKQTKDLDILQVALPEQWKDLYQSRDSIVHYANQDFCGKWKILKTLLQFWRGNGDKVLVFSHSVRLLRMLKMLFASTTSYNVSYLDGAMSYDERAQTVESFNADSGQFVFLISTRAGGVGLNITSANKVVVVDPNWNPSYDLQAQDRAYRIGQTRDVEVFRLVSAGTIEEIVYARQIYKQQQANIGYNASNERRYFRGVQDQKEKKGEIFGLANLFSFDDQGYVLRDIVNKTNVAESRAGVKLAEVDFGSSQEGNDDDDPLPDDERESAAMSQLAEEIASGDGANHSSDTHLDRNAARKANIVSAILAGAGVQYTHENSEVIGSSKVEQKLSKRAAQFKDNVDTIGEKVFASQSQSQSDGKVSWLKAPSSRARSESEESDGQDTVQTKYHPPEDVRKRQFCTMAKTFGFSNATDFALVVEGWTQEQRRVCLEQFYKRRRRKLADPNDEL